MASLNKIDIFEHSKNDIMVLEKMKTARMRDFSREKTAESSLSLQREIRKRLEIGADIPTPVVEGP